MIHKPVLLRESIELLDPQSGEFFVDGTIGSGGHAAEIIKRISPNGTLLAIDWDIDSIENLKSKFKNQNAKLILVHGNYADLPEILRKKKLGKANGLILDLGFSSEQIESGRPACNAMQATRSIAGRGFSFMKDEPLDMRYNREAWSIKHETQSITAAEVVNSFREDELADIFWKYGEERFSRRIAKAIVEERRRKKITRTSELVAVIQKAVPRRGKINPATRTFQALRIYVNHELENLEKALKNLDKIVKNSPPHLSGINAKSAIDKSILARCGGKGRVAIISFHSLEDRIVKNRFRDLEKEGKVRILTKKPIIASREEIQTNPRSRSAKLRAIELV